MFPGPAPKGCPGQRHKEVFWKNPCSPSAFRQLSYIFLIGPSQLKQMSLARSQASGGTLGTLCWRCRPTHAFYFIAPPAAPSPLLSISKWPAASLPVLMAKPSPGGHCPFCSSGQQEDRWSEDEECDEMDSHTQDCSWGCKVGNFQVTGPCFTRLPQKYRETAAEITTKHLYSSFSTELQQVGPGRAKGEERKEREIAGEWRLFARSRLCAARVQAMSDGQGSSTSGLSPSHFRICTGFKSHFTNKYISMWKVVLDRVCKGFWHRKRVWQSAFQTKTLN